MTNAEVLLAHPTRRSRSTGRGWNDRGRRPPGSRRPSTSCWSTPAGRARTIDRQPADLVGLVRAVVDDAGVLGRGEGDRRCPSTGPRAAGCPVDEPTVRRAMANLVDNAIRYAPGRHDRRGRRGGRRDAEVAVVVTDHGPGIPAGRAGAASSSASGAAGTTSPAPASACRSPTRSRWRTAATSRVDLARPGRRRLRVPAHPAPVANGRGADDQPLDLHDTFSSRAKIGSFETEKDRDARLTRAASACR